jgi:hypothetical protein
MVKIEVTKPTTITAVITREAAEDLQIKEGGGVYGGGHEINRSSDARELLARMVKNGF